MCRRASFPVEQHFTRAEQRSSIIAQEYDVFIITQDFFYFHPRASNYLVRYFFFSPSHAPSSPIYHALVWIILCYFIMHNIFQIAHISL